MSERLTHGSLFSGIGGPEIAAEMMGWKNVFHCEINPFGRKILDYWFPNSKSYEDITKTDFREWQGKINVLTGGFPCQPFSCAGQRKGAEDDRYLWPEMLRAIREIQPDWVVGENVAGILTMVQPGSETTLGREESLFGEVDRKRILHRQEYVVETVCTDLEREGYSVQPLLIPACAIGAPHRRDRVWFIANRTDARVENMQYTGQDGIHAIGAFTDTDSVGRTGRRSESNRDENKKTNRASILGKTKRFGREQPAADTESQQSERYKSEQSTNGTKEQRKLGRSNSENNTEYAMRGWENFPTQSPVCSRDDGISTRLDGIAFSKWRQESIKAYGNAIVPQVMYEIFLAIESIEKGK